METAILRKKKIMLKVQVSLQRSEFHLCLKHLQLAQNNLFDYLYNKSVIS